MIQQKTTTSTTTIEIEISRFSCTTVANPLSPESAIVSFVEGLEVGNEEGYEVIFDDTLNTEGNAVGSLILETPN